MTKKKDSKEKDSDEVLAEEPEVAPKAPPKPKAKPVVKRDPAFASGFAAAGKMVDDVFAKAKKPAPYVPISAKEMKESLPHISTGSFILDYLIGGEPNDLGVPPCPGWPLGRVVQIYGPESCGKTTFALMACAEAARRGWPSVYIDWEHAIVPDYARRLGVPIDDETLFRLYQPNTLEDGIQIAYVFASFKVPVMVFDSVGFAVPTIEHDRSLADRDGSAGQPGIVARAWSRELPQLSAELYNAKTLLIAISQLRSSINAGGMGPADTIQGGMVWKYVSSLRIRFKKIRTEEEARFNPLKGISENMTVSTEIEAKIDKTKIGSSQGRKASFMISFGIGVDNIRSAFDMLLRNKRIRQSGAHYEWTAPDGTVVKAQGKKNFFSDVRSKGFESVFSAEARGLIQTEVKMAETEVEAADEGSEEDVSETIRNLE